MPSTKANHEEFESDKERAYLLLIVLQTVVNEAEDGAALLRNEGCVERLLICGTYASPSSIVAPQAFRLLLQILDPPEDKKFAHLIGEYAHDFLWPVHPTPQAIAALPVFYDYRYERLPGYEVPDAVIEERQPISFQIEIGRAHV
jgi:hypothetical protein